MCITLSFQTLGLLQYYTRPHGCELLFVTSRTWTYSPQMNSAAAYKHENRNLKTDAKLLDSFTFVLNGTFWHWYNTIKNYYTKFELTYLQYVKVVLSVEWKCEFRNHIKYMKYNINKSLAKQKERRKTTQFVVYPKLSRQNF